MQKIHDQMIAGGTWTVEEYWKPPYVHPTGVETPKTLHKDIAVLTRPEENLALIMKYGKVSKEEY